MSVAEQPVAIKHYVIDEDGERDYTGDWVVFQRLTKDRFTLSAPFGDQDSAEDYAVWLDKFQKRTGMDEVEPIPNYK